MVVFLKCENCDIYLRFSVKDMWQELVIRMIQWVCPMCNNENKSYINDDGSNK